MLELLADVLFMLHTLGAALGAVGVTFAELFYTRAVVDGKISTCEKKHIHRTFFALQWGVTMVVLSGIGLIIVQYFIPEMPQTVLSAPFWMIHTLTVVVIVSGYLISRSHIPWWLGSSMALTAWWMMLALDAWRNLPVNYLSLIFLYVIFVFVVAGIFSYVRAVLLEREKRSRT